MKNKYTRALGDVHLTEEFREKLGSSLRASPLLTQPYQEKKSPVKPLGYRRKAYIAGVAPPQRNADDRRSADHIHPQHPAAFAHRQQRRAADEHRDGLLHARVLLCRHIGAEHNWYEAGWEYHRRTHTTSKVSAATTASTTAPPFRVCPVPPAWCRHTLFGIRRMD